VTVTLRFNGRPVPNPDSYEGTEDTALSISAPGVLANDTDPDNDPLTAALVTPPLKGTLALQANGSFLYTPRADSNGVDTFTYRANDGLRDSASTTNVTLTIAPVNDAPVASNDSFGTGLDSFLAVSPAEGVLRNDTDVDGQTLTAILIDTTANGTLTLAPDGSFTYQPNPGFSGIDRFTYRASDGELTSAIATATISVGVDLAKVVINEIMYSPATLNPAEEFLEIFNGNPGGLDVSGWKIDAGIGFTIPDGTVIPGSGFLVIAANPTAFSAALSAKSPTQTKATGQNAARKHLVAKPDGAGSPGTTEAARPSNSSTPPSPAKWEPTGRLPRAIPHPVSPTACARLPPLRSLTTSCTARPSRRRPSRSL